MKKLLEDVAAFHKACGVPSMPTPDFPDHPRRKLRRHLLMEEFDEFCRALQEQNIVDAADALADILYVAVGTALEFGIPLDKVWDAVQAANMAKVDPATGMVHRRKDGKILKPDGWTPPDVQAALFG